MHKTANYRRLSIPVTSWGPFKPYIYMISFTAFSVMSSSYMLTKLHPWQHLPRSQDGVYYLHLITVYYYILKTKAMLPTVKILHSVPCGISPKAVYGRAGYCPCNCKTETNLIIYFEFFSKSSYTYNIWLSICKTGILVYAFQLLQTVCKV